MAKIITIDSEKKIVVYAKQDIELGSGSALWYVPRYVLIVQSGTDVYSLMPIRT